MEKNKVVAIVPCRKLSKRLPDKNIKDFCGKPLYRWTLDLALECEFIDEVIVASDDEAILDYCTKKGIKVYYDFKAGEFGRPAWEIVKDVLKGYTLETIVLYLQPTSPLRTMYDISHAFQIYKERVRCLVVGVYKADYLHFKLNGCVYIFSLAHALLSKGIVKGEFICVYIMPKERSADIDTIEDFIEAEELMKKRLEDD